MIKRIMIDFETLGNGPDAAVVQLGAASFVVADALGVGTDFFKRTVDPAGSVKGGGKIDASTVVWWLQQSDAARKSVFDKAAYTNKGCTEEAFFDLNEYCRGADEIWSHATFDFVIFTEALKRYDITPTFSYRAARDIRTLTALVKQKIEIPRDGTHHDALDDVRYQIKYVTTLLRHIGITD